LIVTTGFGLTVNVTAALLKHPVVLFPTLAYTVPDALVYVEALFIIVVNAEVVNQVTLTPAAPPVTVLFLLVRSNTAVPPPVVVSHKARLAGFAAGLASTVNVTAALLMQPVAVVVTLA